MNRRKLLLVSTLAALTESVWAQVGGSVARIVVPFAAGGAREMPARTIQEELIKEMNQNWIIEAKPGAGGAIGTAFVSRAEPDGRTLLMAASSHFVTAAMGARPFYDPIKEFVPVVNIVGIKPGQIKLTGAVLGDIYLGKITKWNDAALTALNAGVPLPAADISVGRRADGSGTSFIFTNYLSKMNADWKTKVGEGTAVNWPVGAGGKGNEGVSAFVQRLPNSIGYVEYAYAKQNKMSHVQLKNQAGLYVEPDDLNFKAAAAGADWNKTFYQVLTEQPGKESWPITGATFILMHKAQDKPANASNALKFFDWAYASGDKLASDLEYVPLPDSVKALSRKLWTDNLKDSAGKAIAYK